MLVGKNVHKNYEKIKNTLGVFYFLIKKFNYAEQVPDSQNELAVEKNE
jgi:hypothetical protein